MKKQERLMYLSIMSRALQNEQVIICTELHPVYTLEILLSMFEWLGVTPQNMNSQLNREELMVGGSRISIYPLGPELPPIARNAHLYIYGETMVGTDKVLDHLEHFCSWSGYMDDVDEV